MKPDAAPAVVREEEKPREEKRNEESATAASPEAEVVVDEEKHESEDGEASPLPALDWNLVGLDHLSTKPEDLQVARKRILPQGGR
jgi:hypothetical protein